MAGNALRVLQVINSFGHHRGGAERLACTLHEAYLARGMRSVLVAIEASDVAKFKSSYSLGFQSPYDPRAFVGLVNWMRREAPKFDVIHVHLFPSSAYMALIRMAFRLGVPCIFTEHNTVNGRRNRMIGGAIDRFVYRNFDAVGAISDGVADALRTDYPMLDGRIETIPNGVALRHSKPLTRTERDGITILSVGRLVVQKNYAMALQAIARLDHLPIRYVILGDGTLRRELEERARALGIADRVDFKGHVEDPDPYFRAADIFLMTSIWEGFGLAAVEAMNASLPVVVSDVAGLREVVGPSGIVGYRVESTQVDGFSEALERLANSPDLRATLGAAAFEHAKLFDADAMVDRYTRAYRSLIECDACDA